MTLTVNGEAYEINSNSPSVSELLESRGHAPAEVAVAVNEEFVPRSTYDEHKLTAGDDIEVVAPMQGG